MRICAMEQLKDKTVFSCQDKRCKNTTCRAAVVHSSRSRSSLWISTQIVCNFNFNTKKRHKIICNFYFIRKVVVVSNKWKIGGVIFFTWSACAYQSIKCLVAFLVCSRKHAMKRRERLCEKIMIWWERLPLFFKILFFLSFRSAILWKLPRFHDVSELLLWRLGTKQQPLPSIDRRKDGEWKNTKL